MTRSIFTGKTALLLAGAVSIVCAGCQSTQSRVQDDEQMLAAAGFEEKPATTPERQQELANLPPFKVIRHDLPPGHKVSFGYIYADPQFCRCVFVGGPKEYQQYAQAALQQRVANAQIQAAEAQQDAAFNWGMWGPYGGWWGPGPW
jgi:hypothetical protein